MYSVQQIFIFQLSSASIHELHINPAIPIDVSLDPLETSVAHCAPRDIFYWAIGIGGHSPTLSKVGEKDGGQNYFSLYGKNLISNSIFSIRTKKY
jgi:hypothetical protein